MNVGDVVRVKNGHHPWAGKVGEIVWNADIGDVVWVQLDCLAWPIPVLLAELAQE